MEVERTGFAGGSEKTKKVKDRGVDKESEGVKGNEGKDKGGRESSEVHDVTSERSLDESRIGEN